MPENSLSILVWNLNNRTKDKPIHPLLQEVIDVQQPDVVTFNEYVDGQLKAPFRTWLMARGYDNQHVTPRIGIHNQVFLASRRNVTMVPPVNVPEQTQLTSNTLFCQFEDLRVCSLRVPAFKTTTEIERAWRFLINEMSLQRPDLILGDLNVDCDEKPEIWDSLRQLGFRRVENEASTYTTLKGRNRRLDHALVRGDLHANLTVIQAHGGTRIVGNGRDFATDHSGLLIKLTFD